MCNYSRPILSVGIFTFSQFVSPSDTVSHLALIQMAIYECFIIHIKSLIYEVIFEVSGLLNGFFYHFQIPDFIETGKMILKIIHLNN